MKTSIATLALAGFLLTAANAQPVATPAAPVCLDSTLIDHTHVIDPKTVLFYMRGGKIWRNTLQQSCPELLFHGFEYVTRDTYICSNRQSIRVLVTDEVCALGEFTAYTPLHSHY
jgi:hypothetical protein